MNDYRNISNFHSLTNSSIASSGKASICRIRYWWSAGEFWRRPLETTNGIAKERMNGRREEPTNRRTIKWRKERKTRRANKRKNKQKLERTNKQTKDFFRKRVSPGRRIPRRYDEEKVKRFCDEHSRRMPIIHRAISRDDERFRDEFHLRECKTRWPPMGGLFWGSFTKQINLQHVYERGTSRSLFRANRRYPTYDVLFVVAS